MEVAPPPPIVLKFQNDNINFHIVFITHVCKIEDITCHIVNFVFIPTPKIQHLQYDNILCMEILWEFFTPKIESKMPLTIHTCTFKRNEGYQKKLSHPIKSVHELTKVILQTNLKTISSE